MKQSKHLKSLVFGVIAVILAITTGYFYQSSQSLKNELKGQQLVAKASSDSLDSLKREISKLKKEVNRSKKSPQSAQSAQSAISRNRDPGKRWPSAGSGNPYAAQLSAPLNPLNPFSTTVPEPVDKEKTELAEPAPEKILNPSLPHISVSSDSIDLGTIRQTGGTVEAKYTITNTGGSDLEIYSTFSSCGCTIAPLKNKTLAPNESTELAAKYDPNYFQGPLGLGDIEKRITIISNDPTNPFYKVYLKAKVIP